MVRDRVEDRVERGLRVVLLVEDVAEDVGVLSAVEELAVEERDGVRFYVEPDSPFKPTKLIRTPGFRKNEPS